jgi:hypothetical protein
MDETESSIESGLDEADFDRNSEKLLADALNTFDDLLYQGNFTCSEYLAASLMGRWC